MKNMKKGARIAALLAVMTMTLFLLCAGAAAESGLIGGGTYVPDEWLLPDEDELLLGYLYEQTADGTQQEISTFGFSAGVSLDETLLSMYFALYDHAYMVASGESSTSVFTIDPGNVLPSATVSIAEIEAETGLTMDTGAISAYLSKYGVLGAGFKAALDAALMDNPYEFYWYDKRTGCQSEGISYSQLGDSVTFGDIVYKFAVGSEYCTAADMNSAFRTQVNTEKTKAATKAVNNIRSILAKYENASDVDKIKGFVKEICALVDYDHSAAADPDPDYIDPWQLIHVFDGDPSTKVVCEGYSKAFQHLCDNAQFGDYNTTCTTVTGVMAGGTGAGGHMWNIVTVAGENYMVDVTNCDAGTIGAPDQLLLATANSGTWDTQYQFVCKGGTVIYQYYEDTKNLYAQSQIELSDKPIESKTKLATPDVRIAEVGEDLFRVSWKPVEGADSYFVKFLSDEGDYMLDGAGQSEAPSASNVVKMSGAYYALVYALAETGSDYISGDPGVSDSYQFHCVRWEENIPFQQEEEGDSVAYGEGLTGVPHGYTVTKPADPTREGYTFLGWYNGSEEWDFSQPVTQNMTLTAMWEAEDLNLSVDAIDMGSVTFGDAEVVVPITITNSGSTDVLIEVSIGGNAPNDFELVEGDGVIKANTTNTSYSIKFNPDDYPFDYDATIVVKETSSGKTVSAPVKASVTPREIRFKSAQVRKEYDGTDSALVLNVEFDNLAVRDGVLVDSVDYEVTNARFDDKNVGENKTVTFNLNVSGGGYYKMSNDSLVTLSDGVITQAPITIPGLTVGFAASAYQIEVNGVNGEVLYVTLTPKTEADGVYTYDPYGTQENGYTVNLGSDNYYVKSAGNLTIGSSMPTLNAPQITSAAGEENGIKVTWNPVYGATDYSLQLYTVSGTPMGSAVAVTDATMAVVPVLASGEYYVEVQANGGADVISSRSVTQSFTYHTVTWDYNDGVTSVSRTYVCHGNKIAEPAEPVSQIEGMGFYCWCYGPEDYWYDFENQTVTEDITLKAEWAPLEASLRLEMNPETFESVFYGYETAPTAQLGIINDGLNYAKIDSIEVSSDAFAVSLMQDKIPGMSGIWTTVGPKAGLPAGTYSATLTVTYDGGKTATAELSFIVNRKQLSIQDVVFENKLYDGTTAATVSSLTFFELEVGDTLTEADYTVISAEYEDANAGTGKTVNLTVQLADHVTDYELENGGAATVNTGKIFKQVVFIPTAFDYNGTNVHTFEIEGVNNEILTGTITTTAPDVGDYRPTDLHPGYEGVLTNAENYEWEWPEVTIQSVQLGVPQNVMILGGQDCVTLTWDPVDLAPGYELRMFKDGGVASIPTAVTETTATFPIDEVGEYSFTIKATGDQNTKASANMTTEAVTYHRVHWDYDGLMAPPSDMYVSDGWTITRPENPVHRDYTFADWYFNGEVWDFATPVTQDMTIKAEWKKITANIVMKDVQFAPVTYGYESAQGSFTLANEGEVQSEFVGVVADSENITVGNEYPTRTMEGNTSYTVTLTAKPGLPAGEYPVRLTVTHDDDGETSVDFVFVVEKKELTIDGAAIEAKEYDGTTDAAITGITFGGVVDGESLTEADYTATASFEDEYAGTDKPVDVSVALNETVTNYVLPNGALRVNTGVINAVEQTLTSAYTSEAGAYNLICGGNTVALADLVYANLAESTIEFSNLDGTAATLENGVLTSDETQTGMVTVQASAAAIDLNGDGIAEYSEAEPLTIYVNVVDKAVLENTLTVTQENIKFGEELNPTVTLGDETLNAENVTLTYTNSDGAAVENPTQPGTYTVKATYETSTTIYTGETTFTIEQADVAVTVTVLDADNLVYNGAEHTPDVNVSFVVLRALLTEGTDYTVSYENNVDAGTATVRVTPVATSTYKFEETTANFTIKPAVLTVTGAAVAEKTYDGKTDAVVSDVAFDGVVTGESVTDYTVTDAAFADAYAGSGKTVNFNVVLGESASNYAMADGGAAAVNNGVIHAAAQTLTSAHTDEAGAYSLARGGNTVDLNTLVSSDAEGAAVVFGGLTGSAATLEGSMLTSDAAATGMVSVQASSAAIDLNGDGIAEYGEAAPVTVYVNITEKNVFQNGLNVTQDDVFVNTDYTTLVDRADGGAMTDGVLTLTYKDSTGAILTEKPTKPGRYTVTATYETSDSIYTASADYEITNVLSGLTASVAANVVYNGAAQEPDVTVSSGVEGVTLVKDADYTLTYNNNIHAGQASVTIAPVETSDYTFTAREIYFTIDKAPLTALAGTVTVTKAYDGTTAAGALAGEGALDGVLAGDSVTVTITAGEYADANAGTGKAVTLSAVIGGEKAANYTLTNPTFTANVGEITKIPAMGASHSMSLSFNDTSDKMVDLNALLASMQMGGIPVFEIAGFDNAVFESAAIENGKLNFKLRQGMAQQNAAGEIKLNVTGLDNVDTLNLTIEIAVTDQEMTIDVSGIVLAGKVYDGKPLTYTGEAAIPGYTGGFTYSWEGSAGSAVDVPLNADSYCLLIEANEIPGLYAELTVEITPAPLTIEAKDISALAGSEVPVLDETSYTVTGLIEGETLVTPPAVAYASAPDMSKPGSVEIVVSGAEATQNYTITYVNGTLTIGAVELPSVTETTPLQMNTEPGSQFTMSVDPVEGATYQWFINHNDGKGFVAIEGATQPSYTTSPIKPENNGYTYYCEVTNAGGTVRSQVFTLHVAEIPQTGDEAAPMVWMAMMLAALAGLVISRPKRRGVNR